MRVEVVFSEKNDEFEPAFGEITRLGVVEDLDEVLTHQEELLEELAEVLDSKTNNNTVIEPLEITENGTYHATKVDGYAPITVNVPVPDVGVGTLTKYAKITAKPESNTSFIIENPLGGIAKKISVIMTPYELTSKRRCRKYVADYDLGIAVGEYSDTDSKVLYASRLTNGTIENGNFKITEGQIVLYSYNSANAWETNSEYVVEIYQ